MIMFVWNMCGSFNYEFKFMKSTKSLIVLCKKAAPREDETATGHLSGDYNAILNLQLQ